MTLALDDLIAAVATPAGPAARSVIRLSGAGVVTVLERRFRPQTPCGGALFEIAPQRAMRIVGTYQIEGWRSPIPVDLWLWPTDRSYTGQPSAELHLIGSPPIVDALLAQLLRDGARPARAGEFTLRSFLAGRVDLVQAEAVLGVIEANDHDQLRTALTQLAGGLSQRIGEVREALLLDLADLEAGLDFVEEDIEFVMRPQMLARIRQALAFTQELVEQGATRMTSGPRPRVVLAGLPNAGKSTLFNRLAGSSRAIVSELAGTTRDPLQAEVTWGGMRLELVDTAGLDEASTGIAAQAETLRRELVAAADLVVWCSALAATEDEQQADDAHWNTASRSITQVFRIGTKLDLANDPPARAKDMDLNLSAATGEGLADLQERIRAHFQSRASHHGEWLASTSARSQDALTRCVDHLQSAEQAAVAQAGDELLSIELRAALSALGEVCGAVHTDDILDRIFSRFCIGK